MTPISLRRRAWLASGLALLAVVLATVAIAGAMTADAPVRRSAEGAEPTSAPSNDAARPPSRAPEPSLVPLGPSVPSQPRLPLGRLDAAPLPTPPDCPPGMSCQGFVVGCTDVQDEARGTLAIGSARGEAHGVVAFFSGLGGDRWWTQKDAAALGFLDELRDRGLTVVQVRWERPWLYAAPGERAGPARLACRSATVIDWIGANVPYAPAEAPCGYCITGNSGGSSQVSYALTRYGLESRVDMVVPTSGPPHAAIADGCAGDRSTISYGSRTSVLDASLGFFETGPCRTGDTTWARRWARESVEAGDVFYPDTAVRFVFGRLDATRAAHHGVRYYLALREAGSPDVTAWVVPCMGHRISAWAHGLETLMVALTEPTVEAPVAPPLHDAAECHVPAPVKVFEIPGAPSEPGA